MEQDLKDWMTAVNAAAHTMYYPPVRCIVFANGTKFADNRKRPKRLEKKLRNREYVLHWRDARKTRVMGGAMFEQFLQDRIIMSLERVCDDYEKEEDEGKR